MSINTLQHPMLAALRRQFIVMAMMMLSVGAAAQITIGGRRAAYDGATTKWLATVPEELFGTTATLSVGAENGWHLLAINGDSVKSSYTFSHISADGFNVISYTDANGIRNVGIMQFTFLPIVQLDGTFGNDYADGTISISDPQLPVTTLHSASVKWRGGTTNRDTSHKHNFKLKLSRNNSFFGLRNDDSWILDAGQPDVFRLRNHVACNIWHDIGSRPYYAEQEPEARLNIRGQVVELFLNGKYEGIYNFCENMDRKQLKLKKVDKNSGQVRGCMYKSFKYDYALMYEPDMTPYDNSQEVWNAFEVKYPDLSDCDSTDWSTLYDALRFVTTSTDEEFMAHVAEYFDLPVVVDFCIFGTALNALDNRGKNLIWAVYDKTADRRLTVVPWDLDCTVGQRWVNYFPPEDITPYYLMDTSFGLTDRLVEAGADDFRSIINSRYDELRRGPLSTSSLIGYYTDAFNLMNNSGALKREERRWNGDSDVKGADLNIAEEYDYICRWIEIHMSEFDYMVEHGSPSGISTPAASNTDNRIFNLSGQYVGTDATVLSPGIYVRGGRKFIIWK